MGKGEGVEKGVGIKFTIYTIARLCYAPSTLCFNAFRISWAFSAPEYGITHAIRFCDSLFIKTSLSTCNTYALCVLGGEGANLNS